MEMDMNKLAWQRFDAAMNGDDFAIPAKDQDLFSRHGEEPTLLSSALTELYHALQNHEAHVLQALSQHEEALRRMATIKKIRQLSDHKIQIDFSSQWFENVSLIIANTGIIGDIRTATGMYVYHHITRYHRDDLGDDGSHIDLQKMIRHELSLLLAEEHHWADQFTTSIRKLR